MAIHDRKCRLIIDSCCDLPADLVGSFGVELINFPFTMNDGEHFDDLGVSISSHEFYERMRKGEEPKTAQVPYGRLLETFENAALGGVPTVYLSFTAALSGTFEVALSAAADITEKYPDFELYVVDSKLPSVAEGLLVIEAVRQLDRGLSAKELVAWAEEARYYVQGYFTLPDLDSLRRGGRIPSVAAIAGAKLDIKPILSYDLDGGLTFHGVARGRKKSIKQLLELFVERRQEDAHNMVIVASADAKKEEDDIVRQVLEITGSNIVLCRSQIGPVIGSHVGPDMLAIVFWSSDRRERVSLTDRIANAVSGR